MTQGIKTRIGYEFDAPHLASGKISLAVGDLVTAFANSDDSEVVTGKVIDLKPRFVTISPISEELPPVITQLSMHNFKVAYS